MTEKKLPTVSTLRRWKRDALEAAFEMDSNKTYVRWPGIMKNFAKVCDILIDEYPHIMNYERISEENLRLKEVNRRISPDRQGE